jgi:hypothetical protein
MVSKYRSIKTVIDGITFDSKKEAARWQELKLAERAGLIAELVRQVPFVLAPSVMIDGRKKPELRWFADFIYTDLAGYTVVEDCKSPPTRKTKDYRIKKHLMKSVHNIDILES